MWKLTIYQKKKYDSFEVEQEVSFMSTRISDLLELIADMSIKESTSTRYELTKIEEGSED